MPGVIRNDNGELVDLGSLAARLHERFVDDLPAEYVPGKTLMRDAVVETLQCSVAEAERLVDCLEADRWVRYRADTDLPSGGFWVFERQAFEGQT